VTRDIISRVIMRMPTPVEKWKDYPIKMKDELFNDFMASIYVLGWSSCFIFFYYVHATVCFVVNGLINKMYVSTFYSSCSC
jgi:hypothetical protein